MITALHLFTHISFVPHIVTHRQMHNHTVFRHTHHIKGQDPPEVAVSRAGHHGCLPAVSFCWPFFSYSFRAVVTLMPGQILASSDVHPPKDTVLCNRAKGQSQIKTLLFPYESCSDGSFDVFRLSCHGASEAKRKMCALNED